jgi:hypothetical protein
MIRGESYSYASLQHADQVKTLKSLGYVGENAKGEMSLNKSKDEEENFCMPSTNLPF